MKRENYKVVYNAISDSYGVLPAGGVREGCLGDTFQAYGQPFDEEGYNDIACTYYNYFDGHNWCSLIVKIEDVDYGEQPTLVEDAEVAGRIFDAYEKANNEFLWDDGGTGLRCAKADGILLTRSGWQDNPYTFEAVIE